ncbi:hypothetical protein [[Limnothrix rosea] IAM M-220]|uniref:hypothetical protein n=1 Tax=[Limnothrix rosea] IAM M-220 TaxID=454133 RepID=UPI00095B59E6|nr:hypothetical protein [[Limnothrix rosea] IAM M-220]OKH19522.1 hypothetical protein NIES208_01570 [[Limnothrix rosea] IAM M-220]
MVNVATDKQTPTGSNSKFPRKILLVSCGGAIAKPVKMTSFIFCSNSNFLILRKNQGGDRPLTNTHHIFIEKRISTQFTTEK